MKAEMGKEVTAETMKKTLENEPRVEEGLVVQIQGKRSKLKTKRIYKKLSIMYIYCKLNAKSV